MRNWLNILGPRHGRKPVIYDARHFIAERAMRDERMLSVVEFLDKAEKEARLAEGGFTAMADGVYYRDTRTPTLVADQTSVAGTAEAIAYPLAFTATPANYLNVGKMNKLMVHGKLITAGASPGTMTWNGRYGTAGSSADVSLTAGAASATMTISLTKSLTAEMWTSCRTTGASGTMVASGRVIYDSSIIAGTAGLGTVSLLPSGAIANATVDTTTAKGINLNIILGSASDNFTAQILQFEALN